MATIYHPSDHMYNPDDLVEFLTNSCEQVLSTFLNTKIMIEGDLNKLNIRTQLNQLSLFQMVKTATKVDKILDVFITNVPNYWKKVKCIRSQNDYCISSRNCKSKKNGFLLRDIRQQDKICGKN